MAAAEPQIDGQPNVRKSFTRWKAGKWVIVAAIVFLVLVVPVFPRDTIVYVDGTTQTVTNQIQLSTAFQVLTTTTTSQINVYTGSYQYFSSSYSNFYYNSCTYCCYYYWYDQQLICNYGYWPWYTPSYGTTVTVTPSQRVVGVTRTQQPTGLEMLTLTYYNGQSTTVQNVYNDKLSQSGTSTVQSTGITTNTITNTFTIPVTQTIPCHQCIPEHVTEYVSLLQLLFGY